MKNLLIGSLVMAGIIGFAASASGQNDVLNELYGRGYHAYFRHDLLGAEGYLTTAIAEGSKDPRVFYYRGLTYLCQGRLEEAEADFRDGGLHEAEGEGRLIGQALDRIQGYSRCAIEKARLEARIEMARRTRLGAPAADAPRELPPAPAHQPAVDHMPPHAEPVAPEVPMATEEPTEEAPAEPAVEEPVAPEAEAGEEPAMPAEETETAEPAADAEPAAPADEAAADPFGDAFGESEAPAP